MVRITKARILFLLFGFFVAITLACRKSPSQIHGRKTRGDNGYKLYLANEPDGYEPGKIYNCK